jgi:hypothetical protein
METTRFDGVTRMVTGSFSRRQALSGLVGAATALAAGSFVSAGPAEAKPGGNGKGNGKGGNGKGNGKGGNGKGKHNGNEKVTLCQNGHTIKVGRPAVRAHLKNGATRGACQIS